jgi:hypothetical protein
MRTLLGRGIAMLGNSRAPHKCHVLLFDSAPDDIWGTPGWADCPPDGTIRSVRGSSHSDRMVKMPATCFWRRFHNAAASPGF